MAVRRSHSTSARSSRLKSAAPSEFLPQLALLTDAAPEGDGWLHELKYDGYRIGAHKSGRKVVLTSRNGKDWTAEFPEIVEAVRALPAKQLLLDGEVAVQVEGGRTSFQALQAIFGGGPRQGLAYFVFDLLERDGTSLRELPCVERKEALARLLRAPPPRLRLSEHVVGNGPAVFAGACQLQAEGIVSKRADAPYTPGRGPTWLKVKCITRQELIIGGFTDPEGSRVGIGALLVGVRDESGALRFAGKVGTGFTDRYARTLRTELEAIAIEACPFQPRPEGWLGRHGHWVRPEKLCEVAFTEWTSDGKVRHPSFQGMRGDKSAAGVVREQPVPPPPPDRAALATVVATPPRTRARPRQPARGPVVAGVAISNPDRLMFPEPGITKLELAEYAEAVAPAMVPHVDGRPLTLLRCGDGVDGTCTFMRHSSVWAAGPAEGTAGALERVRIPEKKKLGEYLIARSAGALVSLVQMDVVEVHTWNTRAGDVERPDRIVLDLDPGPEVPFAEVVALARQLRALLEVLGLVCFVKTTGGAGLHLVVPIVPEHDWRVCLAFSRAVAEALARTHPERCTTRFARAGRSGLILIDYLRNNRTNTSVAAFSPRARPHAPVSVPLAWDELSTRIPSDHFTVRSVLKRLAKLRRDPWEQAWTSTQRLELAATEALQRL